MAEKRSALLLGGSAILAGLAFGSKVERDGVAFDPNQQSYVVGIARDEQVVDLERQNTVELITSPHPPIIRPEQINIPGFIDSSTVGEAKVSKGNIWETPDEGYVRSEVNNQHPIIWSHSKWQNHLRPMGELAVKGELGRTKLIVEKGEYTFSLNEKGEYPKFEGSIAFTLKDRELITDEELASLLNDPKPSMEQFMQPSKVFFVTSLRVNGSENFLLPLKELLESATYVNPNVYDKRRYAYVMLIFEMSEQDRKSVCTIQPPLPSNETGYNFSPTKRLVFTPFSEECAR